MKPGAMLSADELRRLEIAAKALSNLQEKFPVILNIIKDGQKRMLADTVDDVYGHSAVVAEIVSAQKILMECKKELTTTRNVA